MSYISAFWKQKKVLWIFLLKSLNVDGYYWQKKMQPFKQKDICVLINLGQISLFAGWVPPVSSGSVDSVQGCFCRCSAGCCLRDQLSSGPMLTWQEALRLRQTQTERRLSCQVVASKHKNTLSMSPSHLVSETFPLFCFVVSWRVLERSCRPQPLFSANFHSALSVSFSFLPLGINPRR